ncbi:CpaD family pilus assembly protein [Erythrobacter sp. GH1-10]|uniref:CpaD family pilus assembly protein n=1 Tax=Erythrobacter sp. GH1-10 TaxID=3349334 RepID=UPI003877935C
MARKSKLAGALALSIGLAAAGCAGMPTNTSLYSPNQPVVERTNFTFDVQTDSSGLPIGEQSRLNGWFEAMDLRYGDRVSVEAPANTTAVSEAVNELAGRYGLIVSKVAPTTSGYLEPGQARVVITRSSASVPNCPNWSAASDSNYMNAGSPGFGCATNGNLAAMVANPEDLLEGQKGSGETVISTGTKAIDTYREAEPSGAGGLGNANSGGN